jgi:transposase-like protein
VSRHSDMPSAEVEVLAVQRRRRFSAEEKQRMVQETYQPGMTLSRDPEGSRGDCPRKKVLVALSVIDGERHPVAAVCRALGISRSDVAHRQSRRAWRDRRGRAAIETVKFCSSSRRSPGNGPRTGIAGCGHYCGGSAVSKAGGGRLTPSGSIAWLNNTSCCYSAI